MPVRCALFVDFDNVLLSLQTSSKAAARTFATSPGTWIRWFERGGHDSSEHPEARRILLRRSYLNPERFGAYRKFFTYAGFQTVDCPSLTGMGKNSADIHMVLDIMQALEHPTRFDEFIVLSADADFTPVLLKLREHDRLTGVLSTALTSGALRSAATNAFDLDDFIEHALEIGDNPEESKAEGSLLLRGNRRRLDRMTGQPLDLTRIARRLAERLGQEGAVPLDQVPRLLLMDDPAFRPRLCRYEGPARGRPADREGPMAKTATNKTTSINSTSGIEEATSSPSGDVTDTTAATPDTRTRQPAPAEGLGTDGEASPLPPEPQASLSKVGRIRSLLASPAGATLPTLCEATGWQSHSVRAALTGLRKAGAAIEKDKAQDSTTVYRIAADAEVARWSR